MNRDSTLIKRLDWFTIILFFIMVILGWVNIYAAVYNDEHQSILSLSQRYGKQLIWILLSLGIIFLIFIIDGKFYSFFAYFIYAFIIISLLLVLFFGKESHGARSWFSIGGLAIQPAEFAKFATGLALAKFLSTYNLSIKKIKNLVKSLVIIFLPSLLIIMQNDTGSALVYICFFLVLYRQGLPLALVISGVLLAVLFVVALLYSLLTINIIIISLAFLFILFTRGFREFLLSLLVFAVLFFAFYLFQRVLKLELSILQLLILSVLVSSVVFVIRAYRFKLYFVYILVFTVFTSMIFTYSVDYIFNNVLEKHQRTRINILLGIEEDPQGAGYNVHQSLIAIGSGGLKGKGFLKGTQTKFDFVPEQATDFIFCTVGEEWGFMGTSTVVILFVILLLRLIFLAERQKSTFSKLYGYAVISILFFHLLINVGMTIGLTPVIGIPLPFFSYGGSSLWAFTILLFIFIRLDASREDIL